MKFKLLRLMHLRLIMTLAVNLFTLLQALYQIGWLRPWLLPERRARAHWVGGNLRRHLSLPIGLALIHCLVTLITWQLYAQNISPWFLPFTWAASLGTTAFLWFCISQIKLDRLISWGE
jgi:hypothetical protein